jgi:hypothetical protein
VTKGKEKETHAWRLIALHIRSFLKIRGYIISLTKVTPESRKA